MVCPGCTRRELLAAAAAGAMMLSPVARAAGGAATTKAAPTLDPAKARDWLGRWEKYILGSVRQRFCDKETGEEIGWLISPFLSGFYYGYLATSDRRWVDMLIDWADSWIKRGVKEPDGFVGWPKADGASTSAMAGLFTDNMLGEAMALRPVVLMADAIMKAPELKARYGARAQEYIGLAEKTFEKWDARCCWRETKSGGVWVVPPFGIDSKTNGWSEGYARRKTDGFSHPANKQNAIALWLLSMHDVTHKGIYKQRAQKWFAEMKWRMRLREGRFYVWNYWDPAGPWDYKAGGQTRHWVGVHPNGGYYGIDVEGIVAGFEHAMVFEQGDIDRLIATNRDFMWNQQVQGAKFGRIDGGQPDARWRNSPGVLWTALVGYDRKLREVFEANHKPDSWGGLGATPRYVAWAQGRPAGTRA